MRKSKHEFNFNHLSDSTKEIISDLLIDADKSKRGPEGYKDGSESIDEIEFLSRAGFIANSDNFGGLTLRNFTDLMAYFGGGYSCAHKGAAKELERQIDQSFNMAIETFIERHPEFKGKEVSYHSLVDSNQEILAEELSELESESMSCEDSSIMHEFRFLYHGYDNGIHRASVSAAINTEGPYHRSRISWAPNIFCEGCEEVEISWKTEKALKKKLKRALKDVSGKVF